MTKQVLTAVLVTLAWGCECLARQDVEDKALATKSGPSASDTRPVAGGKAKKLALLVGINNYKNFKRLEGCVTDARNMENLLRDVFEFPPADKIMADSIIVLTNEQATHAAIV